MHELTATLRRTVLRVVDKLVSLLTRPFSRAADLETYAQRGYYLLGILLLAVTIFLWWQGFLNRPLSQSNVVIRSIYKGLSEKTVLFKYIPDTFVPLAFLPMIAWLLLGTLKASRHTLGELTANTFFWCLNKGLSAGEWCIEHRWYSLFLIGILSATIAVLATLELQRLARARMLENDFNHWLEEADHFVDSNPLTRPEPVAYNKLHSAWRNDFGQLLTRSDGTAHPAACLHEMLETLYLDRGDQPWSALLQLKAKDLTRITARCGPVTAVRADHTIARAHALIDLLMARIDIRLAEDVDEQPYTTYKALAEALARFNEVETFAFGSTDYGRRYRSDAHNGQGTVYGNALTAYMKTSPPLRSDQIANISSICNTPAECAMRSLAAYESAGEGWEECSFQAKRQRNNTTDLLVRIGQNYERLRRPLTGKPFEAWMRTPVSLATQIEAHVRALMVCNSKEPFFSTFAVTAAQGLAVSAELRQRTGQDSTAELIAAGRYLRFANSFEPHNVSKWDVSCFCFAVKTGTVSPALRDAITSSADALPDAVDVVEVIEKKCP
jgi:hypothetical protein